MVLSLNSNTVPEFWHALDRFQFNHNQCMFMENTACSSFFFLCICRMGATQKMSTCTGYNRNRLKLQTSRSIQNSLNFFYVLSRTQDM